VKILFDQNAPANLRHHLPGHTIVTARQAGWEEIENGELLKKAEETGFDILLTCDQSLSYQQNLAGRKIAIVELTKNNWPRVKPHVEEIAAAVNSCVSGSYIRVICGK
jgi:predicted nuclease of predicted toxin-antitoxin system